VIWTRAILVAAVLSLAGCAGDTRHKILISTVDQKMIVLRDGNRIAEYPVSTSKFGLGDQPGSNDTPLGRLKIKKKIGEKVPAGGVLKSRRFTGEVLAVDAPGRDPIVTRILWLEGTERQNKNAYNRFIYIHGTPEERNLGTPASFGCIRMRSRDVIALYNIVGRGAVVIIEQRPFGPDPRISQ
jgi:lipoprotein-anchoring transpeptidase ErfK/SrfK